MHFDQRHYYAGKTGGHNVQPGARGKALIHMFCGAIDAYCNCAANCGVVLYIIKPLL